MTPATALTRCCPGKARVPNMRKKKVWARIMPRAVKAEV
jgi:hypothetical protein